MAQPAKTFETDLTPHMRQNKRMIPFYSSTQGDIVTDTAHLGTSFWRRNLECPVLFDTAVQKILNQDEQDKLFIEIGPHSTLSAPLHQIFRAKERKHKTFYVPTLIRGKPQKRSLLTTAGKLYTLGTSIDISAVTPKGRILTDLPSYSWQHEERHWSEPRITKNWRLRQVTHHELLGSRTLESSDLEPSWRNVLDLNHVLWLLDHRIKGEIIFPCAGYISMVGEAVRQISGCSDYSVRNLFMRTALILGEADSVELVTTLRPARIADNVDSTWYDFTIMASKNNAWKKHCDGQVRASPDEKQSQPSLQRYIRPVESRAWYEILQKRGLEYGPQFRGLRNISASPTDYVAAADLQDREDMYTSNYAVHPILIDQSLQLLSVAATQGLPRHMTRLCMPTAIEKLYIRESRGPMFLNVSCGPFGSSMCGNATLVSNDYISLNIEKGLFFSIEENRITDDKIPLTSYLEWKPHIDFLQPDSLLSSVPESRHRLSGIKLAELTGLYIEEAYHLIKSLTPASEHLGKFKAWIEYEHERIQNDMPGLLPELRQAKNTTPEDRKAAIDKIGECLSGGEASVLFKLTVEKVLNSITDIVEGKINPLEHIMADDTLRKVYESGARVFEFDRLISCLAFSNPQLRILEVGAGTGAMTSVFLEHLTAWKVGRPYMNYTFTDLSPAFFPEARERFKEYAGIEYSVLDIAKDPGKQGFELGSYDLVVATNVIHATPVIAESLCHVQSLLAPGGRLLLQEICIEFPITECFMGILPSWWQGQADGREKPYISPDRWHTELINAGFTGLDVVAYDNKAPYQYNATMLTQSQPRRLAVEKVTFLYLTRICDWARLLEQVFLERGWEVEWCSLGQSPSTANVISLIDLEGPFFSQMSDERFYAFQKYITSIPKSQILWITRSIQMSCDDPEYSLALGMLRTIRHETNHIIGTLEVDKFDTIYGEIVYKVFHKFSTQDDTFPISSECEYCLVDGAVNVGRFQWAFDEHLLDSGDERYARAVTVKSHGVLDSITWAYKPLPLIGEEDVELKMKYTGLNFKVSEKPQVSRYGRS